MRKQYPPGWRRSTGLRVTGSARDPVDEAAVRLAFLGHPWQYAYYGIDPQDRPSSPVEREENQNLNHMLHYKKKYDPESKTWKTIYYTPQDKIKWIDPEDGNKQTPYSIAPGPRRPEKVIYPDEGPRPQGRQAPRKAVYLCLCVSVCACMYA